MCKCNIRGLFKWLSVTLLRTQSKNVEWINLSKQKDYKNVATITELVENQLESENNALRREKVELEEKQKR